MSKLGETVDRILEQLSEREKLSINELQKKVPSADTEILKFMNHEGLIKLKNGEIRITEFGLALLTVE
ncbi:MAG: hypothetical protein Q8O41_02190 [Candidatus Methanoperedens sp.]|nr:hypothetical protein [Candidatus Methanoperedens sp.]